MATIIKESPVVTLPRAQIAPSLLVQLGTAGVSACVADIFTFPLDTTKVRLQLQGEGGGNMHSGGVLRTVLSICKQEGPSALYSGIVPGLQRQMAFSAIRIGGYESVKQKYQEISGAKDGFNLMGVRIAAGVTTGTLAILVAQPTDVVKVRMQAAGNKGQYKGVVDAYTTIARQEGFKSGLYRGTMPNIARNCIVNVGETVVYDAVKDYLISSNKMKDGIQCHLLSAVVAGVTATLVASPVDVVKTRFMNSPAGQYRGAFHCAVRTARTEGLLAFYKGFNASCMRLVSWNIALWLTYEQIKIAVKKHQNS
ncbi:mitochondrial uncoupling protein 2 isoform X1 [Eurytemora carolleeae]|uniref:mitochondrial uncoupling protein 2 isoform X1 n=1 Tax=Eurytemora carolleeae TaxID=1294199 RepID=UPI000C78C76F|nr:mitochondrial uncoupling protein 2 isoform X1 [Eurytemora carolleeae]|eukprot:XP_023324437.1 mitochondrial uncoupling protein 2-like isoform X1 [Eurytemora affinis]